MKNVFGCFALCVSVAGAAEAAPRFATDVYPILRDNCLGCHQESDDRGDLRVETFDLLMRGGESGPPVAPGQPDGSLLVRKIEGADEKKMPPKKDLLPQEIAAIRAWVANGAPGPTKQEAEIIARQEIPVPEIAPLRRAPAPAAAIALRPDGRVLAVGRYKEVMLLDVADGKPLATLAGPGDLARAVAFSPDGRRLVAAGGRPGRHGEIVLWDDPGAGSARVVRGHRDTISDLAFSPDGMAIATSSYDKLITLWDARSGQEVRTFKEHTDAVFPVAFSPDGRWLASGGGDRTVKLWDVGTGKRLYTLADALDAVYALAFHPSGKQIAAGGADKVIRTWRIGADGGALARSMTAHGDAVLRMVYTPDGKRLVTSAADRLVKWWDMEKGAEVAVLEQPDWAPGLALGADDLLVVGRHDGAVLAYERGARRGRDLIRVVPTPLAAR